MDKAGEERLFGDVDTVKRVVTELKVHQEYTQQRLEKVEGAVDELSTSVQSQSSALMSINTTLSNQANAMQAISTTVANISNSLQNGRTVPGAAPVAAAPSPDNGDKFWDKMAAFISKYFLVPTFKKLAPYFIPALLAALAAMWGANRGSAPMPGGGEAHVHSADEVATHRDRLRECILRAPGTR